MYLVVQNNPALVNAQAQNMASVIQKLVFAIVRNHIMEKNVTVSLLKFWVHKYLIETVENFKLMYLVPQNDPVLVIALAQNVESAIQKLEFVIVQKDMLEKNVVVSWLPFWIHE